MGGWGGALTSHLNDDKSPNIDNLGISLIPPHVPETIFIINPCSIRHGSTHDVVLPVLLFLFVLFFVLTEVNVLLG